jgi:LysR family transcriptional regulator, cyn operon transcriptional activator
VPRLDMERELINAELDMAVAYVAGDNDQIVAEPLFEEELVLVVGSKCPQAGRKSLPMRELAKLPLVLLTPEFGARQFVDRFFSETGQHPHVVLEMNAIDPILAVTRNSGLATVLSPGAILDASGLHIVRLTDPAPKRKVGILWRRNGHRSAAALRMAEMIRAAYRLKEKRAPRGKRVAARAS